MKWIAIFFSGFGGLAVLSAGIYVGLERYQLFRSGIRTQGKVVEQIQEVSTPGALYETEYRSGTRAAPSKVTTYTPVVEFQTERGEKVRFRSGAISQDPTQLPIGAPVEVVYFPAEPSKAQVAASFQFLATPLLMIAAGLFFTAMAVRSIFFD